MMTRTTTVLLALGMSLASSGAAESPRELLEQMIPSDLVLAQADVLGLDARQRQAVLRLQADHYSKMPPLLRRMRQERDALVTLLAQEKPDEGAVLAQFERLNAVEADVKRLRFRMAVGVKKVLTAEQQTKALALQGTRLSEGGAAAGAGTLAARLERVKDGLEQWKREGRDVTPLREKWERFREAEDKGFYRQARQALDEAIALLDAPRARP